MRFGRDRTPTTGSDPSPVQWAVMLRALLLILALTSTGSRVTGSEAVGDDLVGSRPPEWQVEHWMGSAPLTLEALRGKVVLVRFWTCPACPYCHASAPVLTRLAQELGPDGLVVLGFYHHKGAGDADPREVARWAREMGLDVPLAIDRDWRTLRSWWLDPVDDATWTSVSFLLDRQGVIRWIHRGGAYEVGSEAARELRERIEALLAAEAGETRS